MLRVLVAAYPSVIPWGAIISCDYKNASDHYVGRQCGVAGMRLSPRREPRGCSRR